MIGRLSQPADRPRDQSPQLLQVSCVPRAEHFPRASSGISTTDLRSRSRSLRKPNESRGSQEIDDLTGSQPSTSANALAPKSCRSMATRPTSMLG